MPEFFTFLLEEFFRSDVITLLSLSEDSGMPATLLHSICCGDEAAYWSLSLRYLSNQKALLQFVFSIIAIYGSCLN
jgi:hypothetical protein